MGPGTSQADLEDIAASAVGAAAVSSDHHVHGHGLDGGPDDGRDGLDGKSLGGGGGAHDQHDVTTREALTAELGRGEDHGNHHHDMLVEGGLDDASRLTRQGRPLSQSKRAQQNRAAQRAFRQRKEKYIKELEQRVGELEATNSTIESLRQENQELKDYILRLQTEYINNQDVPASIYPRRTGQSTSRASDSGAADKAE